ncbi:MAG TPA: polymer-forming cytoskeletal protein [Anaerolineae bacterium]
MTAASDNQTGRNFLSFLRWGQQWLEISGYRVGDVHSEQPVALAPGATLVGNVFAPRVMVAGLLCGAVVTRELRVQEEGQVWGDAFAVSLRIEPGGRIQGWVSSIDEHSYDSLFAEGVLPDSASSPDHFQLPGEILEGSLLPRSDIQLELLHHLQAETAAALAARLELEQSFEKRLSEVAGEAASRVTSLSDQLNSARAELGALKEEIAESQENLRQRNAQIERQTNELTVARGLLTKQNRELESLRQAHKTLELELEQLHGAKAEVDTHLRDRLREIETLSDRVHSLETALQASLQHSAEQEESLIRWQELAEDTEHRAQSLEKELNAANMRVQESSKVIDMLREQRRQAEKEWEKVMAELESLRGHETRPPAAEDGGTLNEALAEATDKVASLESELAEAEQEHLEQLLWYKASLETTRVELEQTRQLAIQQQSHLARLQNDLEARQALLEKWKAAMERVRAVQDEREQRLHALQQQLEQEKKARQDLERHTKFQLEAGEAEIGQYIQATEAQGKQLAELRATLVERELQLKQARALVERQAQFIQQMKEATSKRIDRLEAQLAR